VRPPGGWTKWGRHLVLFLLTCASVFLTGAYPRAASAAAPWHVADGVHMAAALMAILFAHEMGHYVACRVYGIDATLPFFIPAFFLNPLVGTFGAVIRIKAPFPHRRALFDVGLAGPLAGFVVCLPVIALAVGEATLAPVPDVPGSTLGDPLLFRLVFEHFRSLPPEGMTYALGPYGMAAWFGLFVTGLNLLPVGQLDGGHAIYALFRERSYLIARAVWWTCVGLIPIGGPSWILWAILVRFVIGIQHPPTLHDERPLGRGRMAVALVSLLVFVGCFLPEPMPFTWTALWQALRGLFTSS